jgi:hypothetical protein
LICFGKIDYTGIHYEMLNEQLKNMEKLGIIGKKLSVYCKAANIRYIDRIIPGEDE